MHPHPKRELIDQLEKLEENASLREIEKTTSAYFGQKIWISLVGRKVFILSLLLAILTLLLITNALHFSNKKFDFIAYAAWAILPPSWFMFEYTWLFPDEDKFDESQLADLKYKHELSGKIWAGLVVLITVILYLKYGQKIF